MSDSAGRPVAGAGLYANVFRIGHNAFEFVIDFGQQYGEGEDHAFHTRIIVNPVHAKALTDILHDALLEYGREYRDLALDDARPAVIGTDAARSSERPRPRAVGAVRPRSPWKEGVK